MQEIWEIIVQSEFRFDLNLTLQTMEKKTFTILKDEVKNWL